MSSALLIRSATARPLSGRSSIYDLLRLTAGLMLEHGSGAFERYLKVCQRRDIHEVLRFFVAEIGLDLVRKRTAPIERCFRSGFFYDRQRGARPAIPLLEIPFEF
jgi:hypothetical protein